MKEAIRQRAFELGFDDCRFTTAEAPASAAHFQDWLAAGRHGAMSYLERHAPKRLNPQLVLTGARSVICLAASYGGDSESNDDERIPRSKRSRLSPLNHPLTRPADTLSPIGWEGKGEGADVTGRNGVRNISQNPQEDHDVSHFANNGLIARYARLADYHDVLGGRLKKLAQLVDQLGGVGTRSLWYVDTGPILERDFAQRAGIGFVGKHTNVISRKLGNWLFLAEIMTTLEFEPDASEKNHCGSCTRCIAACPTRAITAPFQLDARLCISYLTIELKGSIPVELRRAIGSRIFGCDDCLAVCPWNRFAREGALMKAHAKPELDSPGLLESLTLDEAAIKQRFAGTPLLRAKRRGLIRNVCVALGNVGDQSALPPLQRIASEPDPIPAEHASWAMEQIQARTKDRLPIRS